MLFAADNCSEAVACVERLLSDDRQRSLLGKAAHCHVRDWSWENSADVVREQYCKTINDYQSQAESAAFEGGQPGRLAQMTVALLVGSYRAMHHLQKLTTHRSRRQPTSQPVLDVQGLDLTGPTILESGGGKHGRAS